jgi:AraC family transcriptional regulator of arabinose operon
MANEVQFNLQSFPAIENMGLFRTSELWEHMDRVVDSDVMIFVRHGSVQIVEDEIEYIIKTGQVFFMKHGVRHYGHKKTPAGSEWNWITFTPTECKDDKLTVLDEHFHDSIVHNGGNQKDRLIRMKLLEVNDFQRTCVRFNRLMDHYISGTAYGSLKLGVGVVDLLIDLYRDKTDKANGGNKLVTEVKKYVHYHLNQDIRSADLAKTLQMNYSYISRVFSRATGKSIQKYVMEQKIKESIRLFSESTLNITQVSARLGYTHPYYFTRIFKQVTGSSPTAFLKRGYYDYGSVE